MQNITNCKYGLRDDDLIVKIHISMYNVNVIDKKKMKDKNVNMEVKLLMMIWYYPITLLFANLIFTVRRVLEINQSQKAPFGVAITSYMFHSVWQVINCTLLLYFINYNKQKN